MLWGVVQGVFLPSLGGAQCVLFSLDKSPPVAEEGVVAFTVAVFGCRLLAVVPGRFIGWAECDQL